MATLEKLPPDRSLRDQAKLVPITDSLSKVEESNANCVLSLLIEQVSTQRGAYLQSTNTLLKLLGDSVEARSRDQGDKPDILKETLEVQEREDQNTRGKGKGKAVDLLSGYGNDQELDAVTQDTSSVLDIATYDTEDLRRYLSAYPWTESAKNIIRSLLDSLINSHTAGNLFYLQRESFPRQSNFLQARVGLIKGSFVTAQTDFAGSEDVEDLWENLRSSLISKSHEDGDAQTSRGCLVEIRTSIPIVFVALHLLFHSIIDMDKIFELLHGGARSRIYQEIEINPGQRLRRNSICCSLQYFRVVRESSDLRSWEQHDQVTLLGQSILFSRTASVVILWTDPEDAHKSLDSRSWTLLSLQGSRQEFLTSDDQLGTKSICGGYDAFFQALHIHYETAYVALRECFNAIVSLTSNPDVLFSSQIRDSIIFEDQEFTRSRIYFWTFEVANAACQSIHDLESEFEDFMSQNADLFGSDGDSTGKDVAETDWPSKLMTHKTAMSDLLKRLVELYEDFQDQRMSIRTLRDQLYSATVVLSARHQLELSELNITAAQDISLLRLVYVIFMPLIFVSSLFGMKNLQLEPNNMVPFGITVACVCAPFWAFVAYFDHRHRNR
ncbi:hypothetical protein DL98DRAFT_588335 [Cadophora sp. DSE1049]|nr:hypothetical protein DL98DRAFT_588335 [Cadophora sp. DSE1049]